MLNNINSQPNNQLLINTNNLRKNKNKPNFGSVNVKIGFEKVGYHKDVSQDAMGKNGVSFNSLVSKLREKAEQLGGTLELLCIDLIDNIDNIKLKGVGSKGEKDIFDKLIAKEAISAGYDHEIINDNVDEVIEKLDLGNIINKIDEL